MLRDRVAQVGSLVGLLVVWTGLAFLIGKTPSGTAIVPGPFEVAPELAELFATGKFAGPLVLSLTRTAIGFITGFVAGMVIGITTAKVAAFKLATAPFLNVLLFAPTLVLIYLATVMLGVGYTTVALLCGLVVGPNISIYMRDVMGDFDPDLVTMSDSFRVPTRQRVLELYIPYLVPAILAASRIGFSMSWKVILLSEVFGLPDGIGYSIRSTYIVYDLKLMMAWLMIFVVALLVIEQGIRIAEHRIVRWQS